MNRLLRALAVVLLFEMGALLLYLPWSSFWEHNYFFRHFPVLMPLLLHPSVRGMVSGIGVLDIFLAFGFFNSPAQEPAQVSPPANT
jgi:hypothetical protein